MLSSRQRYKRSTGTPYTPVGALRFYIAPWRRIPIAEELLSARTRMHESPGESFRTGAGGPYSADGRPVELVRNSIISCETPLGVLEFALKQPDVDVFLHYIDLLRHQHISSPQATQ